jgi:1-acyl-sn-glycerol-3-phosphate acyltransferase
VQGVWGEKRKMRKKLIFAIILLFLTCIYFELSVNGLDDFPALSRLFNKDKAIVTDATLGRVTAGAILMACTSSPDFFTWKENVKEVDDR